MRPSTDRGQARGARRNAVGRPVSGTLAVLERFTAANSVELTRADTKAGVLLGFTGAVLGVFLTVTRGTDAGRTPAAWELHVLWWTAVASAMMASVCFVCAIAPRHRQGRQPATSAPGYFQHILPDLDGERLNRAFEQVGHDPTGPMLSSLTRTSAIIRTKYRWIERGTASLLIALPQLTVILWLT